MNNGFRNNINIFLNSLFKLPLIDIYLFHIDAAYFLLFANLILFIIFLIKKYLKNINFLI